MRADALVGLGAVGLVLAAYFLGGSNQSVLESGGSGSTTSAFSSFGGVGTVGSSGGSADLSLSKGSGSGAASGGVAGVVQGSGSGAASGGVAGVVRGSGSGGYPGGMAAGVYTGAADFQPTPKQADMSANSYAAEYKPTISAIQDTTLKGTGSGAVGAISENKKPIDVLSNFSSSLTSLLDSASYSDIPKSLLSDSDRSSLSSASESIFVNSVASFAGVSSGISSFFGGLFK